MIKVIALMGKAGSGKDTILTTLTHQYPNEYNEIVSCTTRPPREREIDGVNYYFLTLDEFHQKETDGDMLETTEFNSWHYGTALSSLSVDKVNIGVFNPAGVRSLLQNRTIDLTVYYIQTNDKERLIRQLSREQEPDVHEIVRRFSADENNFSDLNDIPYQLIANQERDDISLAIDLITGRNN